MIADQNFNDRCFAIIYPTASATVYGRRPKFFMAEHSATAEGENRAYGPTLLDDHDYQKKSDLANQSNYGHITLLENNVLLNWGSYIHKKIR